MSDRVPSKSKSTKRKCPRGKSGRRISMSCMRHSLLAIPYAPRPAFADFFPALVAKAVEFGDHARGHARDERVAAGQAGGAESAGHGDGPVGLAGRVDFAHLAVVHGGDQVAAVAKGLRGAPAAIGPQVDSRIILAR